MSPDWFQWVGAQLDGNWEDREDFISGEAAALPC